MHFLWLWIFSALIFATPLFLASGQALADQAKSPSGTIIKWVDEKGVTHYGDSMPAQYSGHGYSVINPQGVTLKRKQAVTPQANNSDTPLEQQRRDNALITTYTTPQEIDLARDRNLLVDQTAMQDLQQNMSSAHGRLAAKWLGVPAIAQGRLAAKKKAAAGFSQNKKPVPAELTQDLQENLAEIAKIEEQIAQRLLSMEATRQRFENDKRRFVELKLLGTNAPAPVPAPASAPAATNPVPAVPAPKPAPAVR